MPFSRMKPRICPSWASEFGQITKTSASGALEIQSFAAEAIAAGDALRFGLHRAGVGASLGFGEAQTADPAPFASLGRYFALAFVAIGVIGCITSEDCTLIIER